MSKHEVSIKLPCYFISILDQQYGRSRLFACSWISNDQTRSRRQFNKSFLTQIAEDYLPTPGSELMEQMCQRSCDAYRQTRVFTDKDECVPQLFHNWFAADKRKLEKNIQLNLPDKNWPWGIRCNIRVFIRKKNKASTVRQVCRKHSVLPLKVQFHGKKLAQSFRMCLPKVSTGLTRGNREKLYTIPISFCRKIFWNRYQVSGL